MKKLLFFLLVFIAGSAFAADHAVTSATSTVDCDTFSGGVSAGDTLTLDGGTRGPIEFVDCRGTSGNPITIRNDPTAGSRTTVQRVSASTGGFIFTISDSEFLTVDGSGGWSGMPGGAYCGAPSGTNGCGINITSPNSSDSPSVYLYVGNAGTVTPNNIIVQGVEIDGEITYSTGSKIGFHVVDHSTSYGQPPFDVIHFINNYVHGVYGEGVYIGGNGYQNDAVVHEVLVQGNLFQDIGREAIQVLNAVEPPDSAVSIIGNYAIDVGKRSDSAAQQSGVYLNSGVVLIESNRIIRPGENGIHCYVYETVNSGIAKSHSCEIYNNIVVEAGITGPRPGDGIDAGLGLATNQTLTATIYNNTVVDSEDDGIYVASSNGAAGITRNNIVVGSGSLDILNSSPGGISENNLTGTVASAGFSNSDAEDYTLAVGSSAIDTLTANYPTDDFGGTSRPQGANADQGAYEYQSGGGPGGPDPFSNIKPTPCCTAENTATFYPSHLWMISEGTGVTLTDSI